MELPYDSIQNLSHYQKTFNHANEMYRQMIYMDLNRCFIIKRIKKNIN